MLKLSDRAWKGFKIEEIFNVNKGRYLSNKKIIEGKNPYITAKANKNGVKKFIGNKSIFPGGYITIEKVSLSAYYQPYDFYCSHDVSVISNKHLNEYSGLFVCNMIKSQGEKYSYGRQAQLSVIKRESVYLPINDFGEPDYDFMEAYILDKKNILIARYKEYLKGELEKLDCDYVEQLNEEEWSEFYITELFDEVKRGKRLTKVQQTSGYIPYVSSTSINNGVDNFISYKKSMRKYSNCITIANSGSVGSSFYQPFEFIASDHVTHLKNEKMNKYVYLFIVTMLGRLSEKYNFNREINDKRILREKIILPINENQEPDFEYMERFVKYHMKKQYNRYLSRI